MTIQTYLIYHTPLLAWTYRVFICLFVALRTNSRLVALIYWLVEMILKPYELAVSLVFLNILR
jgi:hypothetical protein